MKNKLLTVILLLISLNVMAQTEKHLELPDPDRTIDDGVYRRIDLPDHRSLKIDTIKAILLITDTKTMATKAIHGYKVFKNSIEGISSTITIYYIDNNKKIFPSNIIVWLDKTLFNEKL